MRFLSVCSGIEAASVAWAPLGWKASAFSEIEPFPCAVLAHHYPDVPNLGDMTKFKDWPDDLSIDLLCGGTPCQSFSVAGLRAGLADPRGDLMLTYGAIAARYRPRWLGWENVPGVLSSNEGRDFGTLLGLLGQLGYGYAYRVLDAQYFGVPQRRRRVFVVACLGDWRAAAAVLFERHSLQGHPAPRREARKGTAVGALAGTSPGGGWRIGADEAAAGQLIPQAFGGGANCQTTDVATALHAHPGGSRLDFQTETFIAHSLRGEGFDASEDGTGRGTPLVPVAVDIRNGVLAENGPTQTIQAAGLGTDRGGNPNAMPHILAFDCKASGQSGFGIGDIAGTQRAMGHTDSHTNGGEHQAVMAGMQVRRLTPRECERLQGFPDDYTLIQHRGKPAADGPRYKALGNSWAVPCARWIGSRITAVDAITASLRRAA